MHSLSAHTMYAHIHTLSYVHTWTLNCYKWHVYTKYTCTYVYVEAKLFDSVAIYLAISVLRRSDIIDQ